MFPFAQQALPTAMQTQIETQLAFFTALSKQMLDNMDKINKLNMQAAANVFEESVSMTRELLGALNQNERQSISAGQLQSGAERVRAYQDQVAKIFTDAHSDLAQTMAAHRPVSALDEVVPSQVAEQVLEETNKAAQPRKG